MSTTPQDPEMPVAVGPLPRQETARGRLGLDFWKYFTGQFISTLGSSFTFFAVPLLIYRLTGSALSLGMSMAAEMLPYLFFGLVIGAWVDRVNRKRLMIVVNVLSGALVGSIPVVALIGHLSLVQIYVVIFAGSTLAIFFNAGQFAAVPSLVGKDNLVTANGRIQASYSAAQVAGPVLAGVMVSFVPLATVMFVDAASYVIAALSLAWVHGTFNASNEPRRTSVRQDVMEGLNYVVRHPVLRNISIMMALVNFVGSTVFAQLVLFGKLRLHATNTQIGWLFAVGGVGIIVQSLLAGPLRKRWSFSRVALSALALDGLMTLLLSFQTSVYVALPLLALAGGLGTLFNINTTSLRQSIVPNEMLGRVMSIAAVLAWSAVPIGSLLGGLLIQSTGHVEYVYAAIGLITFAIHVMFAFTALGRADRFVAAAPFEDAPLDDSRPAGLEPAAG